LPPWVLDTVRLREGGMQPVTPTAKATAIRKMMVLLMCGPSKAIVSLEEGPSIAGSAQNILSDPWLAKRCFMSVDTGL
jgi:hypothetical protein